MVKTLVGAAEPDEPRSAQVSWTVGGNATWAWTDVAPVTATTTTAAAIYRQQPGTTT